MMAPYLLGFVIVILLPSPSLARSPPPLPSAINSKFCGSDRVAYEESAAGYRLIINERIVDDPLLICAALESYSASGCFSAIRRESCDRDNYGRRGLLEVAAAPDQGNWTPEERRRHRGIEKKDFAVPGMLLLCCAVICPCFRSRRRSVGEHHALPKELSSMESVSSLDINSAKSPETPLRIPPSPARVPPSPSRFSISPQLSRVGSIHLSVSQIYKATQNFSPSLRLGEGGFGTVYKAVLPDGQVVAVKRAKKEHLSTLRDEFTNEVELLSKIEHRSLVKLLGYTEKGNERIIITEHVPNGTLREHLDGQHGKLLDFNQRLEIAIDVAHALTYLHLYADDFPPFVTGSFDTLLKHAMENAALTGDNPPTPFFAAQAGPSRSLIEAPPKQQILRAAESFHSFPSVNTAKDRVAVVASDFQPFTHGGIPITKGSNHEDPEIIHGLLESVILDSHREYFCSQPDDPASILSSGMKSIFMGLSDIVRVKSKNDNNLAHARDQVLILKKQLAAAEEKVKEKQTLAENLKSALELASHTASDELERKFAAFRGASERNAIELRKELKEAVRQISANAAQLSSLKAENSSLRNDLKASREYNSGLEKRHSALMLLLFNIRFRFEEVANEFEGIRVTNRALHKEIVTLEGIHARNALLQEEVDNLRQCATKYSLTLTKLISESGRAAPIPPNAPPTDPRHILLEA